MPLAHTHTPEKCTTYKKPRKINAHIARTRWVVVLWEGNQFFNVWNAHKIIYSYVKLIKYLNWHKNFSHVHMLPHWIFEKNNCNSRVLYRIWDSIRMALRVCLFCSWCYFHFDFHHIWLRSNSLFKNHLAIGAQRSRTAREKLLLAI